MHATLRGEKATPINLTNHSYFNLAGHDSKEGILQNILQIDADEITPLDADSIPNKDVKNLKFCPAYLNFKKATKLSDAYHKNGQLKEYSEAYVDQILNGEISVSDEIKTSLMFNHNFVVKKSSGGPVKCAKLSHANGRFMEVETTEPGLVLYSGDYIPAVKGKNGALYGPRSGICLETLAYPDSITVD